MGIQFSTVVGRLRITLRSGVAPMASITAWQISTAASISVPMKDSGEYSYRRSIPASRAGWLSSRMSRAASTAIFFTPSTSVWKTTFRWRVEVEL